MAVNWSYGKWYVSIVKSTAPMVDHFSVLVNTSFYRYRFFKKSTSTLQFTVYIF